MDAIVASGRIRGAKGPSRRVLFTGRLLWAHTSRTVALRDQSHSAPCMMIFSQLEMGQEGVVRQDPLAL